MKKFFGSIMLLTIIMSCGNDNHKNMVVNGQINGLKKGTIYLQKFKDTLLINVDSIQLKGDGKFIVSDFVESPEIYFLTLDKMEDEKISFFGEQGDISIVSKLDRFATSAIVTGSKNQEKLEEHNSIIRKFNGKLLELLKEKFEAQKVNDTALFTKLKKDEKNLIKRKYYYTTNFAVNNPDFETSPYLALSELYNANIKLLDTINHSLTDKVKASKYGIALNKYIEDIKNNEQ